jgi:biotin carboxylase
MRFAGTLSHLANGNWLAQHIGSSLGKVEVTAPTRDEALAKMRNELRYRSEYCPCTGVTDDFVQLQVREEGGTS